MSQQLVSCILLEDGGQEFEFDNKLNTNRSNIARIVSATVVRNWNNVGSRTSIEVDGTEVLLPEGFYTVNSLVSYLDTAFKAVNSDYSVVWNADLNRIVISISAGTLDLAGVGQYSRFARITGFSNLPVVSGTSITAGSSPILNQGYVAVSFDNSPLNSRIYVNKDQENTGYSFIIPSGEPYDIESFTSSNFGNTLIDVSGSKLRFNLRNQYNELKMVGGEITILIEMC